MPDDGLEVHDYIHVADVARANLVAIESDVSRESFNVATGTATTLNTLVEIVQKITGTNLDPEYKTPPEKIRAAVSTKLDFSIEEDRTDDRLEAANFIRSRDSPHDQVARRGTGRASYRSRPS